MTPPLRSEQSEELPQTGRPATKGKVASTTIRSMDDIQVPCSDDDGRDEMLDDMLPIDEQIIPQSSLHWQQAPTAQPGLGTTSASDLDGEREEDPLQNSEFYQLASQRHGLTLQLAQDLKNELGNASDDEIEDDVEILPGFCPDETDEACSNEESTDTANPPAVSKANNNPYAEEARRSVSALVRNLLKDEIEISKTLKGIDASYVYSLGREIVLSANKDVLRAVLEGNVAYSYHHDKAVRRALDSLWRRRKDQPSIYMQLLINKEGLSPSPTQLSRVVDSIRLYCTVSNAESDTFAHAVDNRRGNGWSTKKSKEGQRKYLRCHLDSTPYSSGRMFEARKFCNALEKRLQAVPQDEWDEPLPNPLVEFGYTKNAQKRLQAHRSHRSSNYLMNLTEAICEVLFGNQFQMGQFIVSLVFRPAMASLAEILWTRLGDGYTSTGGGFSHCLAGLSNNSALTFTSTQWSDFADHACKESPLLENARRELHQLSKESQARRKEIWAMDDEICALEAELSCLDEIANLERDIDAINRQLSQHSAKASSDEAKELDDQSDSEEIQLLSTVAEELTFLQAMVDIADEIKAVKASIIEGRSAQGVVADST